eukprot:6183381-Pleurochrysis_carterae.AAC.7
MEQYVAILHNNVTFANYHPFPGHESTMPGFDPNHLAHQQPHVKKNKSPGFDPNRQLTAPGI